MRRGGVHGIEMKNDHSMVKDCHFYNMESVFVEEGISANMDETRLIIFEASYFKTEIDNQYYEFKGELL